jgi:hypothetical protein
MKCPNHPIGIRSRDLPACSAVPQTNAPLIRKCTIQLFSSILYIALLNRVSCLRTCFQPAVEDQNGLLIARREIIGISVVLRLQFECIDNFLYVMGVNGPESLVCTMTGPRTGSSRNRVSETGVTDISFLRCVLIGSEVYASFCSIRYWAFCP